jgi:hypothetical protein
MVVRSVISGRFASEAFLHTDHCPRKARKTRRSCVQSLPKWPQFVRKATKFAGTSLEVIKAMMRTLITNKQILSSLFFISTLTSFVACEGQVWNEDLNRMETTRHRNYTESPTPDSMMPPPSMDPSAQSAPGLRFESIGGVTQNTVILSATLYAQGDAAVTHHGHCLTTSPNAGAESMTCNDLGSFAFTGSFVSAIEDLDANTTYYVRAYATNVYGTSLSDELRFTTMAEAPRVFRNCVSANTAHLDFGVTQVAQRHTQRLLITNGCDAQVKLKALDITPPGHDGFMLRHQANTPIYLEPGEGYSVDLIFIASSPGQRQGRLNISVESLSQSGMGLADWVVSVDLSATVIVTGPSIQPLTPVLSFGNVAVGQSATEEVRITNPGTQTLTISSLRFSNAEMGGYGLLGPFRIPTRIEPGQTVTFIRIRFTPNVAGLAEGTLLLISNDPLRPEISIPVRGTGH